MSAAAAGWLSVVALPLVTALWGWRRLARHARADWGLAWLNRLDGLNRLFCRRWHRMSGGPLPLPVAGPALVACNHVSGLDPVLLVAASPRPVRFLVAVEQYERWYFHWLFRAMGCIPVDRDGGPGRAYRAALRALRAGEVVGIFPHGGIGAAGEPREIKRGVLSMARAAGAPVFPVHVAGVGAPGTLLRALWARGRVRLHAGTPIAADEVPAVALARLKAVLNGEPAAA